MKMRFVVAGAACLVLTGTATAAGPVPPVMNGAPGIAVAAGALELLLGEVVLEHGCEKL